MCHTGSRIQDLNPLRRENVSHLLVVHPPFLFRGSSDTTGPKAAARPTIVPRRGTRGSHVGAAKAYGACLPLTFSVFSLIGPL